MTVLSVDIGRCRTRAQLAAALKVPAPALDLATMTSRCQAVSTCRPCRLPSPRRVRQQRLLHTLPRAPAPSPDVPVSLCFVAIDSLDRRAAAVRLSVRRAW